MLLPINEHRAALVTDVAQLSSRVRQELEAFFAASLVLTGKQAQCVGWSTAQEAQRLVGEAEARFSKKP